MKINKEQREALRQFKLHLLKWNLTHNLVSKSQTNNLDEHISDSLSIQPHLGKNLIDVGSGGGFPGIPIAIVSEDKKIFLIESNSKKASFLLHTINKLALTNTKVLNTRVEELGPKDFPQPYEVLTRAFGTTNKTIKAIKALMTEPKAKLRMMRTAPLNDRPAHQSQLKITQIINTKTKGKDKQRILVTIEKKKKQCTR